VNAQGIEVGAHTLSAFNEDDPALPQDIDGIKGRYQILHLSKRDSNSKCIELLTIFNKEVWGIFVSEK